MIIQARITTNSRAIQVGQQKWGTPAPCLGERARHPRRSVAIWATSVKMVSRGWGASAERPNALTRGKAIGSFDADADSVHDSRLEISYMAVVCDFPSRRGFQACDGSCELVCEVELPVGARQRGRQKTGTEKPTHVVGTAAASSRRRIVSPPRT